MNSPACLINDFLNLKRCSKFTTKALKMCLLITGRWNGVESGKVGFVTSPLIEIERKKTYFRNDSFVRYGHIRNENRLK